MRAGPYGWDPGATRPHGGRSSEDCEVCGASAGGTCVESPCDNRQIEAERALRRMQEVAAGDKNLHSSARQCGACGVVIPDDLGCDYCDDCCR